MSSNQIYWLGNVEVNLAYRTVTRGEEEIDLTGLEFDILEHLIRNSDRAISRTELLLEVLNIDGEITSRIVERHINSLQRRLEPGVRYPKVILAHDGGWRVNAATRAPIAFVLMPFRDPFDKYYASIIRPALEDVNLIPLRADEIYGPSVIIRDIWQSIQEAKVVIADLTTRNPNVMYELGLSHALGRPVVIMTQSLDDVPFDVQSVRCIVYHPCESQWENGLRKSLSKSVEAVISGRVSKGPLDPIS